MKIFSLGDKTLKIFVRFNIQGIQKVSPDFSKFKIFFLFNEVSIY